jgi:glutathione S-transferase
MKLYYSKGACSLVVRIIINEISLNSEFEAVDLRVKKTENGADFLKINPKGAVPTLVTDTKQVLTENAVILQYLADYYHAETLLPEIGDFKRYRVLEWLNFITTELHKSFGILFHPKIPDAVKAEIIIPLIKKKFSHIDNSLNSTYLLGEAMTLPDAYLFVMLLWAKNFQIDLSENKNLMEFFRNIKKRDAVKKSLEEEGIVLAD